MAICGGAMMAQYSELWGQRASCFAELPIEQTDIVMLGNSITQGCEWSELFGMANVKNRGISGDIVQGMRDRLEPIVKGKPKKLFVMGGVNDLARNTTPDSISRVMEQLIVDVKSQSPQTQIYLQSCLPINSLYGRYGSVAGKEEQVRQINALLRQVAERQGVTYIDLYPLFVDDEGYLRRDLTNDGLHLLGAGYLVWRDAIKQYIEN